MATRVAKLLEMLLDLHKINGANSSLLWINMGIINPSNMGLFKHSLVNNRYTLPNNIFIRHLLFHLPKSFLDSVLNKIFKRTNPFHLFLILLCCSVLSSFILLCCSVLSSFIHVCNQAREKNMSY